MKAILDTLKNLWFRDPKEKPVYINDVAVRIRAGLLLVIPVYMGFTLYDAIYVSHWIVDGNSLMDTGETDWDDHIIYGAEVTRKVYDYTFQTWVLIYAMFEMFSGLTVTTSRLSPTILIASFLAKGKRAVWKPLVPKRYAWVLGASFITTCLIFFNPDILANWVNTLTGSKLLPTTYNYMSNWIPVTFIWICLALMWMETVLGFCMGCKLYALMVKLGVHKEECEACNDIDWDEIARRKQERMAAHSGQ